MPKRTTTFELVLGERDHGMPSYRWLYSALRQEILSGRLRPGARLPATRDLASQYKLARGTIVNAFEQLSSEGYVQGTVGSGTYVSKVLPESLLHVAPPHAASAAVLRKKRHHVSRYAQRAQFFPGLRPTTIRAFRGNLPALNLFPAGLWAQITARRLRRASTSLFLGCDAMGFPPLREAIAHYLRTSRGVNCSAEQIAIVSGVQEALDLAARVCLDPGDRVCMENPGYVGAADVFEAVGGKIVPVPLDPEGMRVRSKDFQGARLVYITPGHQFPMGITMTLGRRLELLECARRSGALIFEDDYDSEYRYAGRPVPALQGLDRHGIVLFAGSFSKVLFPALRLAYMVVPPDLIERFAASISITTRHAPLLEQAILCDFITEGHFGRHLRRMREIYAERLAVLVESARETLSGLLEIVGIEAGLQTAVWLAEGIDGESVENAAAQRGVEVVSLHRFYRGSPPRQGLQLGFAAVDAPEIRRGARELGIVLESELKARKRGKHEGLANRAFRTKKGVGSA